MSTAIYVNTNAETITTSWVKVELELDGQSPVVSGPYIDHFELVGTPTNAPLNLTYMFTYDSAGADPASGAESVALTATPDGSGKLFVVRALDVHLMFNRTGRTPGLLYFWAKTDVVTSTLALADGTGFAVNLRDSRGTL